MKNGRFSIVSRTGSDTITNTAFSRGSKLFGAKSDTSEIVRTVIENLLQGPSSDETQAGLKSAIPQGTKIISFSLKNGKLSINFSPEILSEGMSDVQVNNIYEQIRFSLLDFPEIYSFSLMAGNKSLASYIPGPKPLPDYVKLVKPAPVVRLAAAAVPGKPLNGKIISLNPGHGWWYINNYWQLQREVDFAGSEFNEDTVNALIIMRLYYYLINAGASVYTVRETDTNAGNDTDPGISGKFSDNPNKMWWMMAGKYYARHRGAPETVTESMAAEDSSDLRSRGYYANWLEKEGPGMDIHFGHHCNALDSNTTVRGSGLFMDTYTTSFTDYDGTDMQEHIGNIDKSRTLANKIMAKFIVRARQYDASWVQRTLVESNGGYAEARLARVPSCFIENGFYSTPADRNALLNSTFQDLCAKGIYEGMCDYFSVAPNYSSGGVITGLIMDATKQYTIPPTRNVFLSGAVVTVKRSGYSVIVDTAATDVLGNYFLRQLSSGTYEITVCKDSYATETIVGVIVSTGQVTFKNILLYPAENKPLIPISTGTITTGKITGTITDKNTGLFVAGAACVLTNTGSITITDGNGDYSFSDLTPAEYIIIVSSEGYNNNSGTGTVVASGTVTLNISLTSIPVPIPVPIPIPVILKGQIMGKVTESVNGNSISGATVTLTGYGLGQPTTTNIDGNYIFTDLSFYDSYMISVKMREYTIKTSSVSVYSSTITTCNIELSLENGALSGTVTELDTNKKIIGAVCQLDPGKKQTDTDNNGKYNFDNLPVNNYKLTVICNGYQTQILENITTNTGLTEKNVFLKPVLEPGKVKISNIVFTPSYNNNNKLEITLGKNAGEEVTGELKIFDLKGRMIRKISLCDTSNTQVGNAEVTTCWDGKNDNNEQVSNGIYFYQLEFTGQKKSGKIVVVR